MTPKNLTDETRVLGQRAAKCVRVYNETHDWQEVLKADSLMVYSTDFRKFVAEKCGLKEDGTPLSGVIGDDERRELAEADAAIDEETEEAPADDFETDGDEDDIEETSDDVEEDDACSVFDLCHWCGEAPAAHVLTLQVSDGDEPRVLRLDHLCADCAAAYWEAVRAAHKKRMP